MFLGRESQRQLKLLTAYAVSERQEAFRCVQFDELETFEHSKLKPVAIPIVVCEETRLILAVDACVMAPKAKSAARARAKYGERRGKRQATLRKLLIEIGPVIAENAAISSDAHPFYPDIVKKCLPYSSHRRFRSRRAHSTGQGELKKGAHDPLFPVNHTAAMLRANMSRLIRKTWCTTKRLDRLQAHLAMYAVSHNLRILKLAPL